MNPIVKFLQFCKTIPVLHSFLSFQKRPAHGYERQTRLGRTGSIRGCKAGVEGTLKEYMVVSQNKGTPISTPKYCSPYYGDPQKGTPNFGKPPYHSFIPGLIYNDYRRLVACWGRLMA